MTTDMERVADAIRAFEAGEIVVVMDDDDRENEGDLIVAAVHCTPEKMGMFIRHTSGIVCAPMPVSEARRLNLAPMVAENDAPHSTAFTVSVDYKHDTTTGISAEERCSTVRGLANPNAGASDFVRPGHIFPLVAREGGVLMRSGHTEAAVDLCRLAGLPPVGVISELVNDDGSVMRGPQIEVFAGEKGLKTVTVADLIAYRQRQDRLVERVDEFDTVTEAGPARAITYTTPFDPMQQLAVVFGDIRDGRDVLVRLHVESVLDDAFRGSNALHDHLETIGKEGRGVVVYLREGSVGVASQGIRGEQESSRHEPRVGTEGAAFGDEAEGHGTAQSRQEEWLEIGLGAQILRDLGVTSIRLMSSKERHYVGLSGFGIEISETITS
ncbi:3,4-dihydroxy-2-butanone-4-phosphate synthase [Ahrensia sp. R2A130]|uniref:3,4-dihydroxy-2-butanone-4-phosphate synthase n=1 Tax=Ahrensia sp. R2A130 TaxID=744979 RepID=UPI0001E0D110|nr:3,4-dihydroxy-2-butanone-4-phosphate synthase [Ahrensia sp. R2A130]EFL88861.1 riboflavin biosynthesis protein ribBA, ic [Ahrensia sp. R2A130]